ncbi:MAG: L-2-hydroxyglutarate oxidase [Candidatus Omnitrophica bacterium]|nr:L-2-hydroxyglutarate oxidase [Candidatus Omnitrophota bacterium]
MQDKIHYDFLIIGSGIMGLAMARFLNAENPKARILVIDKEKELGEHSSGRNSGVLHAGFYYTANSLKARFTVEGSRLLKEYCQKKNIPFNACGKLVVAMDDKELEMLHELERRGKRNGSNVTLISAEEAKEYEPSVFTHKKALYSPDTASLDPVNVLRTLKDDLVKAGVKFVFEAKYLTHKNNVVVTSAGDFEARKIINCAGLYADKVAQDFGFGKKYTMIPFKGLYLKYKKNKTDVRMNVYPVPNLKNPFLGVHFTKTVDGTIKIGPTAIPAFWRENYAFNYRFQPKELLEIAFEESRLFFSNAFGFRDLAFEEIRKYHRDYFIGLSTRMVRSVDPQGFGEFTRPGMRAQLLDKTRRELVQDFVIEGDKNSIHVLNAISPAFTCAFPFAEFVGREYVCAS